MRVVRADDARAFLAFCFRFSDLVDPTSNEIYARIGYDPIADCDQGSSGHWRSSWYLPIQGVVSARLYLTLGLTIAAVAFGGWRIVLPGTESASTGVSDSASTLISTTMRAAFTGAEASLAAQYTVSGSYAGTPVQPPLMLVRADAASYCLQLTQGVIAQHLAGPGGTPEPGAC